MRKLKKRQYDLYNTKTKLAPRRGTVETTTGDRVIGRLFNVTLPGVEHQVLKDLAGDIFMALYKFNPQLVPKERLDTDRLISRVLVEWLLKQPYYQMARSTTTLNLAASVAATTAIWVELLNDEMIQSLINQMIQASQMVGKDKSAAGLDDGDGQGDGDQEGKPGGSGMTKEELEQLRQDIEKMTERLQNSGMLEQLIAQAAEAGANEGERVDAILRSWGINQHSQGYNMDAEQVAKLASQNFDTIIQIGEIIGRVAKAAAKAMEHIQEGYVGPPTKVSLTRDLSRILPVERIKMSQSAPPLIRAMQVSRYSQQGLLGWQPASEGKKAGPFVAYVDTSGSMDGDKVKTAKALAFGLAKTLIQDPHRQAAFRIRSFSDVRNITEYIDQDSPLDEMLRWAEYSFGGGTDFNTPFFASIQDLQETKREGTEGSDMLIITDGWGDLSPGTVKRWIRECRDTMGTRLMFIFIGTDRELDMYRRKIEDFRRLEELSDMFLPIDPRDFTTNPDLVAEKLVEAIYIKKEKQK